MPSHARFHRPPRRSSRPPRKVTPRPVSPANAPRERQPGPAEGQRLTVDVASLAFEGKGVARHEGRVVFVPLTAPGDRAEVLVRRDRSSFLEADLERVVTPGPARREPDCPLYSVCGGCHLMHMDYAAQLEAKRGFVRDALARIAHVPVEPDAVVGAPAESGYRRRATLRGRVTPRGVVLGFLRSATHDLVDVPSCMVLAPVLDAAEGALRAELDREAENLQDSELRADLVADAGGRVAFLIWAERRHAPAWERIGRTLAVAGAVAVVRDERGQVLFATDPVKFHYALDVPGGALAYQFTPGSFTQIHFEQNQKLVETVLERAGPGPFEAVLDLYSGIGNYALPLARRAKAVLGIESSPVAVADARANAAAAGLAHVEFECTSAQAAVSKLIEQNRTFDLVLLNPTRAGAEGLGQDLVRLGAKRMIYVSCHPPTLARDVAQLVQGGYRLERVSPIDLFPQTYHVESVALLTREA